MNWYKKAKKNVSYDYSHVAANFDKKFAKEVIKWGNDNIPDEDIYTDDETKGRENEIHVTIKYGLHTESPDEVKELVENYGSIKVKIGKVDMFEGDESDVVILKIESEDLKKLNKKISKNCKCTDTYPTYKPHCTIAYVKKGKADKYKGNSEFKGKEFTFDSIYFNSKNDEQFEIKLKGKM
jgi:2'-5' RNA ligase